MGVVKLNQIANSPLILPRLAADNRVLAPNEAKVAVIREAWLTSAE